MDIVEKLRAAHLEYVEGQPVGYGPPINPDGLEAADEIERLRTALRRLLPYCDWQVKEGGAYHPTFPSAIGAARGALKAAE